MRHIEWKGPELSEDGRWLRVSPVLVANSRHALAVAWVSLGADGMTPLRPWPQIGLEERRGGKHGTHGSVLAWVVWLGLAVCVLIVDSYGADDADV
jgi:hypothetical protein